MMGLQMGAILFIADDIFVYFLSVYSFRNFKNVSFKNTCSVGFLNKTDSISPETKSVFSCFLINVVNL